MTPQQRNDHMRGILRAAHAENPRYCTTCRTQRPRQGGRDIEFNGGKNARWECGRCGEGK
jgi:hypothetical protein